MPQTPPTLDGEIPDVSAATPACERQHFAVVVSLRLTW